jgi:hypothetical protein
MTTPVETLSGARLALRDVMRTMQTIHYPGAHEKVVQQVAYEHLRQHANAVEREVSLGPGMIVDLIVTTEERLRVGVEIKVEGATSAILRQLHGYAHSRQLDALLLASTSRRAAIEIGQRAGDVIGSLPFATLVLPVRLA